MDIIAAQFTNWQTALEDFQKSVEKDLEEKSSTAWIKDNISATTTGSSYPLRKS